MCIYGKLSNPMTEHRIQLAFNGNREHMSTVNVPNIATRINKLTLKYHKVQKIMSLYLIPWKLRLTLILNQQTKHVAL